MAKTPFDSKGKTMRTCPQCGARTSVWTSDLVSGTCAKCLQPNGTTHPAPPESRSSGNVVYYIMLAVFLLLGKALCSGAFNPQRSLPSIPTMPNPVDRFPIVPPELPK